MSVGAENLGITSEVAADAETSALLARVLERLGPHLDRIIEDFYGLLSLRPAIREVIGRLSPDELARLKRWQVEHVRTMLSPTLPAHVRHERSRELGRIHAMVGVEMDWYVEAIADHRRGMSRALAVHGGDLDLVAAQMAVTERFMDDLHAALLGYRDFDNAQSRVMLRVVEATAEARTVVDLARGLLEALACLDGIVVGFFARPDASGAIQFEFGAGQGLDEFVAEVNTNGPMFVTTEPDAPRGQGPMGRAWRSGEIQRCDSYATDPTTALWRSFAERSGWRSGVSVPLADRHGATRALLTLHARLPGYFASETRTAMLEQVKRTFERALADLEERPSLTSGVSGYVDRRSHLARLAAGDVEMLFQPVISLPDGRLNKLEALARLKGDGRLVPPAEFLPAFGDDELFELFHIGLRQSFEALQEWERRGLTTGVSVNLPVVCAEDDRYARLVAEMLAKFDVEPSRLTLELLETGFVDRQLRGRKRALDDFNVLGVRLAQDDLGSGYSSLLRLRHFAFDEVKIDQTLVRGTELAPALHFIQPITDIAHSLGIWVVIEGLENDGLIEAAVQLGVDAGQGYGIARPMPAGDVVDWANGYRLDVDPLVPSTAMGAMAGHVAWEHRVSALGEHHARESLLGIETCPLTSYIDRTGRCTELHGPHQAVHAEAVGDRGSVEHREAWQRLTTAVGD